MLALRIGSWRLHGRMDEATLSAPALSIKGLEPWNQKRAKKSRVPYRTVGHLGNVQSLHS